MLIHISRPDALTSIKVLPLGRRVGGGDQGNIKKQDLTPRPVRLRMTPRFPEDFMFQLNKEESENLRFHFGTSSQWGGRRYPPYAFTEQGVAMLSSVLRSKRAVQVNIEIMRTFVVLRSMLAS